ncbi:hypothetical protein [Vibrio ezurae]|uniref:Uncharacterized protein n=1 Tax=Vibrio ezurae NBRC 102218 TaxID=1219080 RepID=U3B172_9VIBR|nr:hypothetical protein [Vibrio ezurae]GAD79715.1 hypothetical protein VEZ01S_19_01300 [Vibrio ezurae NBRC 102218]
MIKYLYGKKEFLEPIAKGEISPRFSDLGHYSRLENALMRDKETEKEFLWDKNVGELFINGHHISRESLASDPIWKVPPRHCYCLCLSSKKNSNELFERFNADYCLAIDIPILIESLKSTFGHEIRGLVFQHSEITYYAKYDDLLGVSSEQVVFYKPELFLPEAEYRIAIFYPLNEKGFYTSDGRIIPFQLEGESTHLQCNMENDDKYWSRVVVGSYEKTT